VEERLLLETKALHIHQKGKRKEQKISGKPRYSRISRNGFEHIKLPAKLLDCYFQNNKSNINPSKVA